MLRDNLGMYGIYPVEKLANALGSKHLAIIIILNN